MVDRQGLDTYLCNRQIGATGGDTSVPRSKYKSHTFVFITDEDGKVVGTFSWGNATDHKGWNLNQREDIEAAAGALKTGKAELVRDRTFDRFVRQAYFQLQAHSGRHVNGILFRNCKTEAQNLIHQAEVFEHLQSGTD